MKLWVVGQTKNSENLLEWEFQGVFDNEEKAINACINENYFIGPVELNKKVSNETIYCKDWYYPHNIK